MARTRTIHAPRGNSSGRNLRRPARSRRSLPPELLNRDPNGIYPVHRTELMPIAMISLIVGFLAFLVCARNGWLLLYGDAVAHLGIARRILDARYPGLSQLGGVWLPLPHLLMLPLVQKMEWWQTGFAGSLPSLIAYVVGNLGFFRLARRLMPPNWAFLATAFFALNPNLLYLSTTAMTEPLFLALFLWSTVITMEAVQALRENKPATARIRMVVSALLTVAMVFTRYDGWILGAAAWLILAVCWFRSEPGIRRETSRAFLIATVLTVAGPLLWFAYNAKYEGDWLDFMRGPYSASAIEKRTSPPGSRHYRGWHNPAWALLFYTRTAQVDAAFWESGFVLLAASLAGAWMLAKRRVDRIVLLLWLPLPFYVYSIAWGSVPIFIPQLYPHSYYNSRYGMEMLPAFAVCGTYAVAALANRLRAGQGSGSKLATVLLPVSSVLVLVNIVIMLGTVGTILQALGKKPYAWVGRPPLVYQEGVVNARTRIPFEKEIAAELLRVPADAAIMFDTTDHIGAVQDAGLSLQRLISPLDAQRFDGAKGAPAQHANIVIALDNDPVAAAVKAHPEGLSEIEIICHTGQPCARIYRSDLFGNPGTPKGNTP